LITLFRNGSPLRILSVLAFLLLLRLPVLLDGVPVLSAELKWMLVGERMDQGFMLYTGIWDNTAPLSACVYWLIDLVFGRSPQVYQVIALLLVMGQAAYFNASAQRRQLFSEKTSVPGLLYVVCMSLFFDFFTLSPVLMGTFFLLFAMDSAFAHLSRDTDTDEAFAIGFYIGVATLFYLPLAWFAALMFVALLLLSAVRFRKFFLLLFGFGFPTGIAWLLFYLMNGQRALYFNWINATFSLGTEYYATLGGYILILLPFAALLLVAGWRLFGGEARFINYQIRCQQLMVLWVLVSGWTLFFVNDLTPSQFIVLVPSVVFFGTHYFLLLRQRWLAEVIFAVFLGLVLMISYGGVYQAPLFQPLVRYQSLVVGENPVRDHFQGEKVLILGDEIAEYQHNTPATPYLNWTLARRHFDDLDNFVSVTRLYENFRQDPPEVIIDKRGIVPKLFDRIPALGSAYQQQGNTNVYVRQGPGSSRQAAAGNKK
jgi:hypothetical protein